eukprot:8448153-Pyramimonas_sp.AAC.1
MGPRNAVLGVADACGHPYWAAGGGPDGATKRWDLGWSSLWDHEALYWVWSTHVATPTGASGGAPYGTTKCCTGCGGRMWPPPVGTW